MKRRAGSHYWLMGMTLAIGLAIGLLWIIKPPPVKPDVSDDQDPVLETVDSDSEIPSRLAGKASVTTIRSFGDTIQVIEPEVKGDTWERVRILSEAGAFPFVRVVDEMARNPESDEPIVVRSLAMLADHVAISVPEDSDEKVIRDAVEALGYSVARAYPFSPVWQIALGRHDPAAVPEALAALGAALPEIAVEPDILYVPDAVPDDYDPVKMWGLSMIEAEAAWSVAVGSEEIVVGIIDSGAQLSHPDLAANIWVNPGEIADNGVDDDGNGLIDDINGWDFAGNDRVPNDAGRHGTHVSGTVGAVGDNRRGLVGVNWTTRLVIARAGADTFQNSALANAIDYLTDLKKVGVNVVATNNSYGGAGRSTQLESAIKRSADEGILFVAAAGNEGSNNDLFPSYPANYDLENVISVASTNLADRLSIFSNYGADTVDLAAPGSAIRSTIPGGSYGYLSGTSMASPHVAGAIALVFASEPDLDWREARDRIFATVDPIPALNGRVATGGRLNLRRALGVTGDLAQATIQTPEVAVVVLEPPVRDLELVGATGVAPNLAQSTWSMVSGPGAVTFSNPGGPATRASFALDGLYRIRFGVESTFRATEDEITVVVASSPPSTDGLQGFWRFEETSGGSSTDSSGNGREGSLTGVVRTSGLVGKAADFDGVSSVMSFNSVPTDKISISAWVRSDSLGEFVFPRIMDTPDYIFYFGRRTGDVDADINSIKFYATKTVQDGIWHTANNTIADDRWLHVGVSYDGSDAENFPLVFLNGEVLPVGVDARSGDQARGVVGEQTQTPGTAFIGENADGERAWDGLIDEVRLYTRALDRAEMAWIAAENDANIVLDHPLEIEGTPQIGRTIQIGTEGANAVNSAKFEWWVPEGSAALLKGSVESPSVIVAVPTGGTHAVRLQATLGLASVIRQVEFAFPSGSQPTPGFFKGGVSDGNAEGVVHVMVGEGGMGTFLGLDSDGDRLVLDSGVVIDNEGQFEFTSPDGTTWRGQFGQDGYSGLSSDGLATIQGVRTSETIEGCGYRAGPVIGTANERLHILADPNGGLLLVLAGTEDQDQATGTIAGDGSYAITDSSGRLYTGFFGLDDSVLRGRFEDGGQRFEYALASEAGFPGERLGNISTRGPVKSGDRVMIAGFVVEGDAGARVLVRGVGPGLSQFDLDGLASATELILRDGSLEIGSNRGWKSEPAPAGIEDIFGQVGAFNLLSGIGDSALVAGLDAGIYTVEMKNPDETGGLALVEVYDVDSVGGFRLVNLSTRGYADSGDQSLIAGFVLDEEIPRRVLVRAAGPALDGFDIEDWITDPKITLLEGDTVLATNDDWNLGQDGALIASLGEATGAFAFAQASSDAALTRYLSAGRYTVRVEPARGSAGVALIEIYVVPDTY